MRTAQALQARGHTVRAICIERIDAGPDEPPWQDDVFEGVNVRRLNMNLDQAPDPFLWEYDNCWVGEHVRAMIEEDQPDIFHLISGYKMTARALHVAQEMGLPTVVTLTDFWFICRRINMLRSDDTLSTLPIDPVRCARCVAEERRRYRIPGRITPWLADAFWRTQKKHIRQMEARQAFLRTTLNRACAIISPSQFLRSVYIEEGVQPERIIFSRQGRDFPDLTPELLAKTPSDVLRVGYIGQLGPVKGVHVLFEAVRRLSDARLVVRAYGNPAQFPHYMKQLQRLAHGEPRIEFAGVRSPREMTQVWREIDVLVVPSVWYENSPNVILEAFAHCTPVIASNLGGMAELVQHEKNGLLFTPGNVADLARQLSRVIAHPDLLNRLRAGIEPIKSVKEEMDELEAIYRRVLEAHAELRFTSCPLAE